MRSFDVEVCGSDEFRERGVGISEGNIVAIGVFRELESVIFSFFRCV